MKLQMMTHGQSNVGSSRFSPYFVPQQQRQSAICANSNYKQMPVGYNGAVDLRQQNKDFYNSQMSSGESGCYSNSQSEEVSSVSSEDILLAEERLRPLIKEELRYTIKSKRLARGLPEDVQIEFKKPIPDDVTPATLIKRERRRERNKVAAAKCRFKKKMISEQLQEESEHLESINANLKREIQKLQEERQKLIYILNLHRPTCIVRSPAVDTTSSCSLGESSSTSSDAQQCVSANDIINSPSQPSSDTSRPQFEWQMSTESANVFLNNFLTDNAENSTS